MTKFITTLRQQNPNFPVVINKQHNNCTVKQHKSSLSQERKCTFKCLICFITTENSPDHTVSIKIKMHYFTYSSPSKYPQVAVEGMMCYKHPQLIQLTAEDCNSIIVDSMNDAPSPREVALNGPEPFTNYKRAMLTLHQTGALSPRSSRNIKILVRSLTMLLRSRVNVKTR